ncbi:c-type cytochrome [Shewanella marinintestina]|uniref:c-type cytochrome n=1 Tax=Shewanella marinintestina TaxID=190305 RepID=UPI00200E0415|nr:c-type cytochrome [Shewanella marinintestina]MCL1145498.1 c-type cytochrome [Shewanella marinintestina]
MKRKLIILALLISSGSTYAAMPPSAVLCGSCHGPQGQGVEPLGPRLAGLSSDYIAQQVKLFQTGKRQNVTMAPMAMTLQGPAIKEVADYFSTQDVPVVTPHLRGEKVSYTDPTEQLVYQGDWERMIPACVTCHGPSGVGVGDFPRLAGQQASYIKNQLIAWQQGTRGGDQDAVMGTIAGKLTAAEIEALAQYFSTIK